jgi:hypothetical protein
VVVPELNQQVFLHPAVASNAYLLAINSHFQKRGSALNGGILDVHPIDTPSPTSIGHHLKQSKRVVAIPTGGINHCISFSNYTSPHPNQTETKQ